MSTPTREQTGKQLERELRYRQGERWQDYAGCTSADPEAWYPESGSRPSRTVRRICAACPVRKSCLIEAVLLDWAGDNEGTGTWAGSTPQERLQVRDELLAGTDINGTLYGVLHRSDPAPAPVAQLAASKPVEHGTTAGYNRCETKCADCRAAIAAYRRERRQEAAA